MKKPFPPPMSPPIIITRSSNIPHPTVINPQMEEKLQDIFNIKKCEVTDLEEGIDLDGKVAISFTYNTTDETLAGYAAILSERYGITPEKIAQKSAWNFKTLEFPAQLRLKLDLTELHTKLRCGQKLAELPKERDQQVVEYSPRI